MSTAFTDRGASVTLAGAPHRPQPVALADRRLPMLLGLLIALALLAASALFGLLLTSAAFGYPSGGIA